MFTPTRIEIRNIGSIRDAVIEPHPTGITVFDGHTGSGKSTAANAVAWVMYGHIGGVASFTRQGDLRSDFCQPGEVAEGVVEFEWGGSKMCAVRRLRRTKSGTEKAEAELWIDGARQAGMTPDKLTEKIVELTGMSGKAFTHAFFVPQHQLERMAVGTPAEVQAIIEDQTGLNALTRQIDAASVQARDAHAVADSMPGSAAEVKALQTEVDQAQVAAVTAHEAHETAQAKVAKATETHDGHAATLADLQRRRDGAHRAAITVANVEAKAEAAADELARLRAELAGFGSTDAAALLADKESTSRAVNRLIRARHDWELVEQESGEATATHQHACVQVDQYPGDLPARIEAAQKAVTDRAGVLDATRADYRQTQASMRALEVSSGDAHHCPTCAQQVSDLPAVAARLHDKLTRLGESGKTAATHLKDAQAALEPLQAQHDARRAAGEAVERALAAVERVQGKRATVGKEAADATAQMRSLLPSAADLAGDDLLEAGRVAVDRLAAKVAEVDRQAAVRTRADAVETNLKTHQTALEAARAAASDTVDDDTYQATVGAERESAVVLQGLDQDRQRTQTEAAVTHTQVKAAEKARDQAQGVLDKKLDALLRSDTLRHAHAVLAEQRRELLAQYTETISEAASQVMLAAGGGRHVGVHLDESFQPHVVLADGRLRPFRNCSGGEKIRAALCLCLGQVELHTQGATVGMLFADEIATGYDADTTNAVIEVITGLNRPMILIGHNEQTRQIANRVYEFDNPDDTGTRLALAGATPAGAHTGVATPALTGQAAA